MEGFTVKAAVYVATGSDETIEAAVADIRTHLAFYASTPAYRPVLDLHGWGEVGAELTGMSKAGRWGEMSSLINDDMLHAFAIVAPLGEVPALLARRCAGIVNRVSFISLTPPPELVDSVRRIGP